jgi:hypothetical protein
MKVRLHRHPFAPTPPEVFEVDSLAQWLLDRYERGPRVGFQVFAGEPSAATEITGSADAILRGDAPEYVVLESPGTGFEPILANIAIAFAVNTVISLLFPPTEPSFAQTGSRTQQSPNNALSERQNRVRALERVEDIYGTVRAIPSLMMPTYSKYIDHQKVEYFYGCISRGYVDVSDVKDGDDLIADIDGASAAVYAPFTSPNSGSPQLQIGPAIIDGILSVERSSLVDGVRLAAANEIGGSIALTGDYKFYAAGSAGDGTFPSPTADIIYQATPASRAPNLASVATAGQSITIAMAPITAMREVGAATVDPGTGTYTSPIAGAFRGAVVGSDYEFFGFTNPENNGIKTVTAATADSVTVSDPGLIPETGGSISVLGLADYSGVRTIATVGEGYVTLTGVGFSPAHPAPLTGTLSGTLSVDNGLTDWSSWVTLPETDRTEVWVNVVALNGLYKDDGSKSTLTVQFEMQVEQLTALLAPTGTVETVTSSVSGATSDERAETLEHVTGWTGPARVRLRRTTAHDYAFNGAVVDEIKWVDLYAVSPVTKAHFGNKTTIHTVTKATQRATSLRVRELNCLAARKLPVYDGTAFSGAFDADGLHVSGTIAATSRIVDIIAAVAVDPRIGNRVLADDVDMAQLWATQQALDAWQRRGGAVQLHLRLRRDQLRGDRLGDRERSLLRGVPAERQDPPGARRRAAGQHRALHAPQQAAERRDHQPPLRQRGGLRQRRVRLPGSRDREPGDHPAAAGRHRHEAEEVPAGGHPQLRAGLAAREPRVPQAARAAPVHRDRDHHRRALAAAERPGGHRRQHPLQGLRRRGGGAERARAHPEPRRRVHPGHAAQHRAHEARRLAPEHRRHRRQRAEQGGARRPASGAAGHQPVERGRHPHDLQLRGRQRARRAGLAGAGDRHERRPVRADPGHQLQRGLLRRGQRADSAEGVGHQLRKEEGMPAITIADLNNAREDVEFIAEVANSEGSTAVDRLGNTRKTVAGIQADVEQRLDDALDEAEGAIGAQVAAAEGYAEQTLGYLQAYRATSYGALPDDPVVDPNGNPCTLGDEYFNTADNVLKRFNGSIWTVPDIDTTLLAQAGGSALVGYTPSGVAGAVLQSLRSKLGRRLSPADFGPIGNGNEAEDTAAFLAWAAALSLRTDAWAEIPPGQFLVNALIAISSPTLRNISIEAWGAEIVVTMTTAAPNRQYFRVRNTVSGTGYICHIAGLTMRHNRPTSRQSDCDMISVAGFQHYFLDQPCVPSADNMGITVGRGDSAGYAPKTLLMVGPRVGGYYMPDWFNTNPDLGVRAALKAAAAHSHGSIGDTGIWVVNAPELTHILGPKVESTGDDAILIGESTSAASRGCYVDDIDLRDIGGNGVVACVPYGRITGRIDRTNCAGVVARTLQGTTAEKLRVDVACTRIGWLRAGDIGTSMISKVNTDAFWVYKGGEAEIDFEGSSASRTEGAGLKLQTQGTVALEGVRGRMSFDRIGEKADGTLATGNVAVIRRSLTGGNCAVKKIALTAVVRETRVPLLQWLNSAAADDTEIDLQFEAYGCSVDAAYTNQALMTFTASSTGRVKSSSVALKLRRCTFGQLARFTGGNLATDVPISAEDEAGTWHLDQSQIVVTNSRNAFFIREKAHNYRRQLSAPGQVLAELNPALFWRIKVFARDAGEPGAYWKGWWDPASQTATATGSSAGAGTPLAVALNTGNATYAGGTLEVRAGASGYSGVTLDAQMVAIACSTALTNTNTA